MTISSLQEVDPHATEIKALLSTLLGCGVTVIERIGGGRNSKVYRVTCASRKEYAAKIYFRSSWEKRDRIGVEFYSLQFLWENGVICIPQPIATDRGANFAIYEYVQGERIVSQEATKADIDYAVQFLARLKELRNKKESRAFPMASDACFSAQAIVDSIETRLSRLSTLGHGEAQYKALNVFLVGAFTRLFNEVKKWSKSNLSKVGIPFPSDLRHEDRTLSPSDFGFHNALRCGNGKIVFLDFEYFGWDDPAKMVADFLLHPAMELSESLKRRFVRGILKIFEDDQCLAPRIESVYPLLGLTWCLILLNEFLPADLLRRLFAATDV